MTTPPNIRVNFQVPFPSQVVGASGITVSKSNGIYTIGINPTTTFTSSTAGFVPASGGGTLNFLRADGLFQPPLAGQLRLASDLPFTTTTALADVTGLSLALQANVTYGFDVYLSFTDAAAGGIKAAISSDGTLTATAFEADGWIIDSGANGIKGNTQASSLGSTLASSTTSGTAGIVQIKGCITVNVAGTMKVQAAQNTSSGTATTIKRGSYMLVYYIP